MFTVDVSIMSKIFQIGSSKCIVETHTKRRLEDTTRLWLLDKLAGRAGRFFRRQVG